MMNEVLNKATTIGSLAIGFQIIDVVAKSETPLKFTDIQELTGVTKSNLYKYLNTLTQMDLLYRDSNQGSYSLGYKFLEYGNAAMQNSDYISRLAPYFKEISKLTNMTILLSTWVNDSPTITHIWNTNYGLNIGAQIGTKSPLLSATGKIFAAYASNKEVFNWIEKEQTKYHDFDLVAFQREMKEIRKHFVAFAQEPIMKHVSSWGLPVLNYNGELILSATIVGFSDDIPKNDDDEIVQKVIKIVKDMSRIYGFKETE